VEEPQQDISQERELPGNRRTECETREKRVVRRKTTSVEGSCPDEAGLKRTAMRRYWRENQEEVDGNIRSIEAHIYQLVGSILPYKPKSCGIILTYSL
jgi:hypothetical protein